MPKKKTHKPIASLLPADKSALTKREKEVADLIAKEYSYKMISDKLGMTVRTVGTHVRSIHAKTGKHNAAGVSNHLKEMDERKK